jgi:hypothetical protein
MNRKVLYAVLVTGSLWSCVSDHRSNYKIEGIYIGQSQSEFSRAFDTIHIKAFNKEAQTFVIVHKTGYQRIDHGVLQKMHYKTDSSVGLWDEESGQLREQRHGRIYSFPLKGQELLLGSSRYQKIKLTN